MEIVMFIGIVVLLVLFVVNMFLIYVNREHMDELEGMFRDVNAIGSRIETHTDQISECLKLVSFYSKRIEQLEDEVRGLQNKSHDSNGRFMSPYTEEEKERAIRYMEQHEDKSIKELSAALGIPRTTLGNWAKGKKLTD